MTHSAVCKQPTLKAPSGKYAQLVYDSTIQFHESLEPVLSALHRRAIGLTKCANYDAALHDANLMQQLSPYSVLAYLCEATIYSEQGKQLDVIDICDQGLSMIDTMDTHYDTLQQLKTDAEQHLSKTIDFVSQLPIEIVIAKLIPLFMDDSRVNPLRPNPYLHVSNVWRDRIVQCFDGLCFNLEKIKEDPGVETRSEITRFAQHTTALSVCLDGQTTWLGDLFCENDYCSLQKLCVLKSSDEGTTIDDFISSLKSVRSTVTDLDVGTGWTSIHLSLSQAVLTFSNLVSLDLRFNGRVDVSALPMTTWPKLTTLTIYKADKEITHDDVVGICKRFPSLKTLELQPCQDIDAALLIPQYYPWMKSLTLIDNVFDIQCRFYNKAQYHDGDDDGRDGITEFLVSEHGNEPGTLTTIDAFLKQHRTTLANMRWDLYHDSDVEHTHDIQYPRLKKLSAVKSGWWIPRNAPQLEELRIAWITITGYHEILDIIPPNMKKLVMDLEHKQPHEDDTILLNYLSRMDQRSELWELDIRCKTVDDIERMLDVITRFGHLQRLMIYFSNYFDWDSYEMEAFFEKLAKGCSRLACLEVEHTEGLSIGSIHALKQLESLKRFNFSIQNTSDNDDFWEAIQNLSQLECIRIYPAREVNMIKIRYLKSQRPDMEVIVDAMFSRF